MYIRRKCFNAGLSYDPWAETPYEKALNERAISGRGSNLPPAVIGKGVPAVSGSNLPAVIGKGVPAVSGSNLPAVIGKGYKSPSLPPIDEVYAASNRRRNRVNEFKAGAETVNFEPVSAAEEAKIEERKIEEEAKKKAQEETKKRAQEEAKKRAQEEAKKRAQEEAKKRAQEEAEKRAQEEAKKKAQEEVGVVKKALNWMKNNKKLLIAGAGIAAAGGAYAHHRNKAKAKAKAKALAEASAEKAYSDTYCEAYDYYTRLFSDNE